MDAHIELAGLSLEAVARLTEILLGGVPAVELVKLVTERSEGNPYFVEQIIRYLQEENFIEMSQVGWNKVKRTRDFFLPGDIRAVLVARLDQLTYEVKDVVQTASVLGREFALSVLAQMTHAADNLERIVTDAEQYEIWARKSKDHYVFTHGLLREAAYTMQMRARRQELHTLAVDALEKIFADELKFHYAELAYHAERAELPQKTQHYYWLAGASSADAYRNIQAIDYFTRALAFTLFDDLASQFDLLAERIALYHRLGDRAAQARDLDSLEKLARQLGDKRCMAKAEMLYTQYYFALGEYLSVVEHATRVMELRRPVEDVEVSLDTYVVWSLGLLRLGKLDSAMQVAQDGLQLAQTSGQHLKEGNIFNSMGLIALEQKNPAASQGYLHQALSIAQEAGDRNLEAKCLNNLGNAAGFINYDYASARKYYEQAYAIVHARGDRSSEGIAMGNLGWSAGMQGDLPAARAFHERALVIAREVGNIYQETYTLINLSAVTGIQQDAEASLAYAQASADLSRKNGERSGEAWSLLYLGYGYLMIGDLEQAENAFQGSIQIRTELGQPALLMEPVADLIQVHLEKNDQTSALARSGEDTFPYNQWRHARRYGRAASNLLHLLFRIAPKHGSTRRRSAPPGILAACRANIQDRRR